MQSILSDARIVYVISDLHIGGREEYRILRATDALADFIEDLAARPVHPVTELVINGDFMDFLAEEVGPTELPVQTPSELRQFSAFREEAAAVNAFLAIAGRSENIRIFAALNTFITNGHLLTLVLGNHDIELSLPAVQEALAQKLGLPDRHSLRLLADGHGYVIGDTLIEHGNRYDPWNMINHDHLRRLCSLRSRRQPVGSQLKPTFEPPPGSKLVATVMNNLKSKNTFIDLLHPSHAAVCLAAAAHQIPVEDAINYVGLHLSKMRNGINDDLPSRSEYVASDQIDCEYYSDYRLEAEREYESVTKEYRKIMQDTEPNPILRLLATVAKSRLRGARATYSSEPVSIDIADDLSQFIEEDRKYVAAARTLCHQRGFRNVIFGHTHLARDISFLEHGKTIGRYINSGTWAELMHIPEEYLDKDGFVHSGRKQELVNQFQSKSIDLRRFKYPNAQSSCYATYITIKFERCEDKLRCSDAALKFFIK